MKDIFLEMSARGATVIFSTHNMEEAEKMCNSICLINKGKVVVDGDLRTVKESYGRKSILVEGHGELAFLKDLDCVDRADTYENYAELRLRDGEEPGRLLQELVARPGLEVRKFEVVSPTLRNIFIDLVRGVDHER